MLMDSAAAASDLVSQIRRDETPLYADKIMDAKSKPVELSLLEIENVLWTAHAHHLGNTEGALANYIPELAAVDPHRFGIAIATETGKLYEAGDTDYPFTIQSVSKAFVYCLALELAGRDAVLERVGVEPSGDAFNAIFFDPNTNRPFNPMVNAGAITVAGIVHDIAGDRAFDLILDRLSDAAGRRLSMDEAVYRSEAETGHRNRAIGHLLRNVGALQGPVDDVVDLYFRQCSIRVTATDLARMGATLAHLGENPRPAARCSSTRRCAILWP